MSSSAQATRPASSARAATDLTGRAPAGLVDVLDRAEGPRRPRPVHRAAARPAPLRSVRPAPPARATPARATPARATPAHPASARAMPAPAAPVPRVVVVPERVRRPSGGLPGLVHRAAMWGAGEHGEFLAWRAATAPAAAPAPRRRRGVLRTVARRMALWGAGDSAEHLAWSPTGSGPSAPDRRVLEPPVVLRELPGTPSIQPVAPSPAAALPPAGPASSPGSRAGTAAPGATARPSPLPGATGSTVRSQPHAGRPPRDRPSSGRYGTRPTPPSSPVRSPGGASRVTVVAPLRSSPGSGTTRTRGDPFPVTARGSPAPERHRPANGSSRPFPVRASSSHTGPAPPAAG